MTRENAAVRYKLRPAISADCEFVRRLNHQLFRPFVEQIWGWDEPLQDELVRKGFRPDLTNIIACDGVDIGFFVVERLASEFFLRSIVIAADYQRKGIGSSLMHALLAEATASNQPIILRVLKPNPVTPFYERFGFRFAGETETHRLMKWSPRQAS